MTTKDDVWQYAVRAKTGKPPTDTFIDVLRYSSARTQILIGDAWINLDRHVSIVEADVAEGNLKRVDPDIRKSSHHTILEFKMDVPPETLRSFRADGTFASACPLTVLTHHNLTTGPWTGRPREWWSVQYVLYDVDGDAVSDGGHSMMSFSTQLAANKWMDEETPKPAFPDHLSLVIPRVRSIAFYESTHIRKWLEDKLQKHFAEEREKAEALANAPTHGMTDAEFAKAFRTRFGVS